VQLAQTNIDPRGGGTLSDLLSIPSLVALLVALAIGVAAAVGLLLARSEYRISLGEFGVILGVIFVVSQPAVGAIGMKVARDSAVGGYVEFVNGRMDLVPDPDVTHCERDGVCNHVYRCDSYKVWEIVRYDTEYYTDSQGKRQSRSVPVYDWVTHWHSCPYATQELTYKAQGNFDYMKKWYTLAHDIFGPNARRYRADVALPRNVSQEVPSQWAFARQQLEAGFPISVTTTNTYKNYLLAVQDNVLKEHSGDIEKYRQAGLLVPHTQNLKKAIFDGWKAKKFTFVGCKGVQNLSNDADWQDALGRLNARFGMELQGDLHVLAVEASCVDNPDTYTQALIAYWQSREFGKYGLSKNGVALVVGVDDAHSKVVWARGKTGVPIGNDEMLSAFSLLLPDKEFGPRTLLGWPGLRQDDKGGMNYRASGGAVEDIILNQYRFERPCMDCKDKKDKGTPLTYLKSSAFISTKAKFWIGSFRDLFALVFFAIAARFDLIGKFRSFTDPALSWLAERILPRRYQS
jgi:hypothetical protein